MATECILLDAQAFKRFLLSYLELSQSNQNIIQNKRRKWKIDSKIELDFDAFLKAAKVLFLSNCNSTLTGGQYYKTLLP